MILLVSVTIGGTVYRIASEAVDVPHVAAGLTYSYAEGVSSLTVSTALAFLSPRVGYPSVPVECVFPADVAALRARGMDLARADVEISTVEDGDDYEDRIIIAVGQASDPTYGAAGEPVAFSVERATRTSTTTVPDHTEMVDGVTHPDTVLTLAAQDLGVCCPLVFGQPYAVANGEFVQGSQGVWSGIASISTEAELVIAGCPVDQQFVYLSTDTVTVRLFPVYTRLDGRNNQIAFVPEYSDWPTNTIYTGQVIDGQTCYGLKYSASGDTEFSPPPGEAVAVFVTWYSPTGGTGGLSPLAGDVIRYLLDRAGVAHSGFQSADLAGYRFDCVIDTPTKPEEWLAANVYPLLPMSVTEGAAGLEPVIWRYDAGASDVTARLNADTDDGIMRAGPVITESGDIANRIRLEYQYSVRAGRYCGTVTRGDAENPDAYCLASQAIYGVIERTLQTAIVYDPVTAGKIVSWYSRAYAFPRTRVRYMIPAAYNLHAGQVVSLTDADLAYSEQVVIVSAVEVDGTALNGVELLIIADPVRDNLEV